MKGVEIGSIEVAVSGQGRHLSLFFVCLFGRRRQLGLFIY